MILGNPVAVIVLIVSVVLAHADATIAGGVALARDTPKSRGGSTPLLAAIIYIEGDFPRGTNQSQAELVQRNARFEPAVLPIRAGTRVAFRNCDRIEHELFSFSAAKRFELGTCRPNASVHPSEIFSEPGLVTVRCALHDEMRAFIVVLPTPYFTTTDSEGNYSLSGIPSGRFLVKCWLNSRTILKKEVELRDGAKLEVNFP